MVIPSRYESFGIVALEAAAANTPVLMTEACGIAPIFRKAGLPIADPNPDSISTSLVKFIQDEGFRGCQRAALRNLPWVSLSWREVARKMLILYEGLVEN